MNLKIKKTETLDIPHILMMIREFAEYENLLEYCEVTEENLLDVLFGENAFVQSLIAFDDEMPIAYAIFFPFFSSFRGRRGIYLEDIYIKPDFRRFGLGKKILHEIAKIGKAHGGLRIDFQVLKDNSLAQNFYKKLGAVCNEDETHFKFDDEAFQNLADNDN